MLSGVVSATVGWMQTELYWGDERCVPLDHPDSNYRMARSALLSGVGGVHALFPMRCDDGDDAYNMLVSSLGRIDVVHLGLGSDGHTASLFPDSAALDAHPGRLVMANVDPSGVNPHPRMTFTLGGIARGRTIVVTVSGAEKAEAFARVRDVGDVPGAAIAGDRVIWLVDEAAAGH